MDAKEGMPPLAQTEAAAGWREGAAKILMLDSRVLEITQESSLCS